MIPSIEEIDRIAMQGARWALVIEKEVNCLLNRIEHS
jgi:hypothetical protein